MNKQVSYKIVSLIFSILVICFAIAFYAFSWTGPTAPPPGDNVDPPINIGGTSQYKSGALGIGGVFRAYSNAIIDGKVGIGIPIPSQKLDVSGRIHATEDICTDAGGGVCLSDAGGDGSIGAFGSWTDKDSANKTLVKDVVYKVSSDGFIEIITTSVDEPGEVWLYTGSTSNPETVSARNSSNQNYHYWTIHYPIPKDTYFKVVLPVLTATIKWLPIGVGDCVEQP